MAGKPNDTSSDYTAMSPYWQQVEAILGGAKTMRAAGETHLPKFPMEDADDYKRRRKHAKFTNIFRDIVENLAAKPFGEELTLAEGASERVTQYVEDIDGKGNSLHVFASKTFFTGIADSVTWILVDYTKSIPPQATIAQERELGARPYWVHIPAKRLLAVYSEVVRGVEVLTHARIEENIVERDGFSEVTKKRVRVFDRVPVVNRATGETIDHLPATWQLFEERKNERGEVEWVSIEGPEPVTIGIVPLVPFITGQRIGSSWQFVPSMQDAADLQVYLYQQESGLDNAKEATAFPMLSGNGVEPPKDAQGKPVPISVGPKAVLYAPPREQGTPGNWDFIEPDATSLKFLADDITQTKQDLRELGRQPLTAQTGNLTVVTTAFAAQKGNTAIQKWALGLKDALEQALVVTAMWLKEDKSAEVKIDTDFDLGINSDKDPDSLLKMREKRDLSQRTLWAEFKRRGTLSPEFDPDEEESALAMEGPEDPNEVDTVNNGGNPLP